MKQDSDNSGFRETYLDKLGVFGSIFTALCCLGVPVILSALTAIGLGFLIHDSVLLPLLSLFLVITMVGLIAGKRCHNKNHAVAIGIISALMISVSIWFSPTGVGIGLGGLILAVILNMVLQKTAGDLSK